VFHCDDVVSNLPSVVGISRCGRLSCLVPQQLADVGLGSLDSRAQDRLEPQVRPDEEVRIGNESPYAAKAMDRTRSLIE
jgi:hypothetical protein